MNLEKSVRKSFDLRVIRQRFTDVGSENRVLFNTLAGDRVDTTVDFIHCTPDRSEWMPHDFSKINESFQITTSEIIESVGNGDFDLGNQIFDSLLFQSIENDRDAYFEFKKERELEDLADAEYERCLMDTYFEKTRGVS